MDVVYVGMYGIWIFVINFPMSHHLSCKRSHPNGNNSGSSSVSKLAPDQKRLSVFTRYSGRREPGWELSSECHHTELKIVPSF